MKKFIFVFALVIFSLFLTQTVFAYTIASFGTTGTTPYMMTIDASGNLYTANFGSNDVSKITPEGVSTILGTTGTSPFGITVDGDGNIYTANSGSNNVSKITPDGSSTILGTTGSSPEGITIDAAGNIYTANISSHNVSKITPEGVSTILGTAGSFPRRITIDGSGNVYTSNFSSNNVSKITPEGVSTILGTTGTYPHGITMDTDGNIYTSNYNSNNVSKITPLGVSTIFGTTGTNPQNLIIDEDGNIYTPNYNSYNISKITPEGVSTIIGTTGTSRPFAIAIDGNGNIYVARANRTISKMSNPTITEISPVPTPTTGDAITYTFSTNSAGTITYGGSCDSATTSAVVGSNSITFDPLSVGTYDDCTITVTDSFGPSNILSVPSFTVELGHDATISSDTYTVSAVGGGAETITNIPYGTTTKADFLAALTANSETQTWDDTDISDPIATGDTLVVTAEDGTTIITYTITINSPLYWYKTGADSNWTTLTGNWWTDQAHTQQAETLPTGIDAVITVGTTGPSVDLDGWTEPASIDASATGITFTSEEGYCLGDSSLAELIGDATFNNNSCNYVDITGDVIYNDESYEGGTIVGNASFYDQSYFEGYIEGNACFVDADNQNYGEVDGTITVCDTDLPIVTTGSSVLMGDSDVALSGTITDTGGVSIDFVGFQYGIENYESIKLISGTYSEGSFNGIVSSLTCDTTYQYRAFAHNTSGTGYGSGSTFTTSPCNNTVLYGVDGFSLYNDESLPYLYTLDPTTGDILTTIGAVDPEGHGYFITALAFNSTTQTLYGGSDNYTGLVDYSLFTINISTGAATWLGYVQDVSENYINIHGLAFSPEGVLYAFNNTDDNLYTIDVTSCDGDEDTSCLATRLGESGIGGGENADMAFDSEGNLYLFALGDYGYYLMDPDDGSIIEQHNFDVNPSGSASIHGASYNENGTLFLSRTDISSTSYLSVYDSDADELISTSNSDLLYISAIAFSIPEYTLTYTAGSDGTITGDTSQTVKATQDGTAVTAVPNDGFHFSRWGDGVTTASRTDTDVVANLTAVALFAADSRGSSGSGGGGGAPKPKNETVCPVGHLFSVITGKPCTSFTTNPAPTTPPSCSITQTLRLGSRGEEVKCLQTKLNILSDGMFGPQTRASVIGFQKLHNLVQDGIFGPKSRAAMFGM